MQADAQQLDELREMNLMLKARLLESNQRFSKLETELKRAQSKLKAGLEMFKESTSSCTFPVMQNNGLVVDFGKIISKWASVAEEDENTPSRPYTCSSTRQVTSLARFSVTDRIQQIACALGLKIEPPLLFERKTNDTWTQLSTKHHIELTAMVCYFYANRESMVSANALLDKDVFTFTLSRVMSYMCVVGYRIHANVSHLLQTLDQTPFTLHCQTSQTPIRMRINRTGWNPFHDMLFDEDH